MTLTSTTSRRAMAHLGALLLLGLATQSHPALAQAPTGPVLKLVVPAPPGGAMDNAVRLLSIGLGRQLAQPVVVENRPGAQTMVGTESVVRAAPDGQTLIVVAPSIAMNPAFYKVSYDALTDLAPVTGIIRERFVLVARKDLGATTLDELLPMLRVERRKLSCGAPPGPMLLGCEQLRLATGADLVTVPFNGIAPAANAVVAGHVDLAFLSVDTVMRLGEGGRVTALAMGDAKRLPHPYPGLPLLSERLPGFVVSGFYGLMTPAKTPPERIERLARAVHAATDEPDFRELLTRLGATAMHTSPQEFGDFLRGESERLQRIARESGMKAP